MRISSILAAQQAISHSLNKSKKGISLTKSTQLYGTLPKLTIKLRKEVKKIGNKQCKQCGVVKELGVCGLMNNKNIINREQKIKSVQKIRRDRQLYKRISQKMVANKIVNKQDMGLQESGIIEQKIHKLVNQKQRISYKFRTNPSNPQKKQKIIIKIQKHTK